jgi:hypothetical protein
VLRMLPQGLGFATERKTLVVKGLECRWDPRASRFQCNPRRGLTHRFLNRDL